MSIFKKAFLYIVGAAFVAYEEAEKAIKEQREKVEKALDKVAKDTNPT